MMADFQLPDGLVLIDSFTARCGCRFGDLDPAAAGITADPGDTAFVCVPCSLLCPTYSYFRESAVRQSKPIQTQIRRTR